ncbi:hypothetical protein D3C71_1584730 [compost metagenome]
MLEQCGTAEDSVGELAVGHCQEESHHQAQVDGEQHCHGATVAPGQQGQAAQADQEQQQDEASIHGGLGLIAMGRITPVVQQKQAGWTDEQTDATGGAEQYWQAEHRVGCL